MIETLRSFTFEPCKIGYEYKGRENGLSKGQFWFCKWFNEGGQMGTHLTSPRLVEKYKFKNIYSPDFDQIRIATEERYYIN